MTLPSERFDYHRNRLRGVPLDMLGVVALEILRDVAAEAAALERQMCAQIADERGRRYFSNGSAQAIAKAIRNRGVCHG